MNRRSPDAIASRIENERRRLLGLCYRMLGSVVDAEDAVQETYSRWSRLSESERVAIESPRAWLMKVASRVCLDVLGSARQRREQYFGEWLPEPLPQVMPGRGANIAELAVIGESISMAMLVILETMTPAERVTFLLHDVFGYSFAEIAEIVGRSPGACRQLSVSARKRLRGKRTQSRKNPHHKTLIAAFKLAWENGDVSTLLALLDPAATVITDGGGRVSASPVPVVGANAIVDALLAVRAREHDLRFEIEPVNGELGLAARARGEVIAVIAFGMAGRSIRHLWVVRNPEKLRPWN